jgi:hypothetical protein
MIGTKILVLTSHTLAHSAGTGIYRNPRERFGPYLEDWFRRQRVRLAPKTLRRYETITDQGEQGPD